MKGMKDMTSGSPKKGNSALNGARYSPDNTDEWYTTYETVAEEVSRYREHFTGKAVLCNCDDPYESNFCGYFLRHFGRLKLKKLICTSFSGGGRTKGGGSGGPAALGRGRVLVVTKAPGFVGEEAGDDAIRDALRKEGAVKELAGNGDFRTEECAGYMKECDVCCTNPPFSLFSELFSMLVKHEKQFLLIGNQNAITYKEIFPYIKENKAWTGYRFGDMAFRVPEDTRPRSTRFWVDESGQKWRSLGNAMWLTNLDTQKRHQELALTRRYDPADYPKYDGYDAIDVKRVADIPMDYDGIMGVPITYLKYHNGSQFEIVGEANHGSDNEFDLFKPKVDGKELFKRILIRRMRA